MASVVARLELQRQYDAFAVDVHGLREALDGEPTVLPNEPPLALAQHLPLDIRPSEWPRPPRLTCLRPALKNVLAAEERTFSLLRSANDGTNMAAAAARPPSPPARRLPVRYPGERAPFSTRTSPTDPWSSVAAGD